MPFKFNPFTDKLDLVDSSSGAGPILTLTASSGGPVPPTAGNINEFGTANQITTIGNAGTSTITFSIPTVFIAPGSIEATTSVRADTVFLLPTTSATAGQLEINGNRFLHSFGTLNTFIGTNAGNFTLATAFATANTGIGAHSLTSLNMGSSNTALGTNALTACTNGTDNCAIGTDTLLALTTGSFNTGLGSGVLVNLLTGLDNIALGQNSGTAYIGAESSNIVVGNVGIVSESNVIRIGTQGSGAGEQNTCFIAGIEGVTPSGTLQNVTINSSGQLGSAPGTANISWSVIGASQTLAVNHGYFCTTGAALALALPASSIVGDTIEITLDGSTSWSVTQGAGQQIRFGNTQTTSGVGGSLTSTLAGDTIRMVCSVANLRWNVLSSIGNLTVV